MDLLDMGLLGAAGMAAGGVNAIAGGGSLISFPALLAVGCPNIAANVTNTVALWPGYVGGVAGYRAELDGQRGRVIALSVTGVLGAVAGCVLLLVTPAGVFAALVPVLIALASVLLAAQPWLKRRLDRARRLPGNGHRMMLHGGVLVGGAYGAYFGAGLGVMLLGLLGVFVHDHLQRLNAVRAVLSLVINTVALIAFALFGPVRWPAVGIMAVTSLAGGFLGARVARRMSPGVLRAVVVTFGLGVAVALALR
ncbi:sulfite exporter TauE/SafE family protein [Actinoallomurus rhizosphaericola]|uniref:sulfite exporter TauE/SafE family protein n=1 Tax=Actinoallomurus rhizosphaericola TaxID=2952536 RepID=UPI002092B8B0|nr:sulfite exporter TauE/SafE family protein [Actinoallomurus rhizosphaericola]MCO5996911.1 sulfite exporter TauE/SafE family protein [Actinoallomurus rhizosphaericola]